MKFSANGYSHYAMMLYKDFRQYDTIESYKWVVVPDIYPIWSWTQKTASHRMKFRETSTSALLFHSFKLQIYHLSFEDDDIAFHTDPLFLCSQLSIISLFMKILAPTKLRTQNVLWFPLYCFLSKTKCCFNSYVFWICLQRVVIQLVENFLFRLSTICTNYCRAIGDY